MSAVWSLTHVIFDHHTGVAEDWGSNVNKSVRLNGQVVDADQDGPGGKAQNPCHEADLTL
jgi:hypothetical protein